MGGFSCARGCTPTQTLPQKSPIKKQNKNKKTTASSFCPFFKGDVPNREAVPTPFLEMSKPRLDFGAWSYLVEWNVSLPVVGVEWYEL